MAIAYDAFSSTTGNANPSWTHTPSGTPKGIIVLIIQPSGSDTVTGVTYGGVTMTESSGSPNLKTATEALGVFCYFLGSSIPTGAQTVAVSTTGSATKVLTCISVTGSANTEVVDTTTISNDSLENPSGTLSLSSRSCFCAIGFGSGAAAVGDVAPLSGWTSRNETDMGAQVAGIYTYDTVGTSDVTMGWTQAADDAVAIGIAVAEVSTITAKVTAADAQLTYTEVTAKVTAADAQITYDIPGAKVTAADAEVTYTAVTGKVTASDAEVTYTPVAAQVTAADAEVTYSAITAKVTASDAEITYSETGAPTGKITAADAEITYTTVIGQVTAADAEVTYTTVEAKITAADAEVTFTERGAQITASDAEITYTPVTGKITAVDAEVTHDTVVAKVTAADAEITFNERTAKITAADAEITYDVVPGAESAKITAVDIVITYERHSPVWKADVLRRVREVDSAPDFPLNIVLQHQEPLEVPEEESMRLTGRFSHWQGRNPFSIPGGAWDPLPLAGIIWYTYNNVDVTDFSVGSLSASPMQKGYQYSVFKQILVDRINARSGNPSAEIVEIGDEVWLYGEVIIDLLSMLDLVIVGHWIPGYHCQQIKARSTAPNGTKIVLWGNFEDINQSADWVPEANDYKDALAAYPLASTGGFNAYGCTSIDQFESNPWTTDTVGCPHPEPKHNSLVWPAPQHTTHGIMIDIYARTGNANYLSATTKELLDVYNACVVAQSRKSGSNWYVDGFFFDTVMDRPLKGTSTLDFEASWTTERYVSSWRALFAGWHHWNSQLANPYPSSVDFLWGNLDDGSMVTYTAQEIRNRYLEWYFIKYPGPVPKTKEDIYADMASFASSGAHTILGLGSGADLGNIAYWGTTPGAINPSVNGTWLDVATYAKRLSMTYRTYALAFRTSGTGNYLMLQDVMRRPT